MRNYDNRAYAANRLNGTIVRTREGKAVEVQAIGDNIALVKELVSGNVSEIPYNNLDITPVPLGYVNTGTKSIYYSRIPLRNDWKQGARWKNLRMTAMVDPRVNRDDVPPFPEPVERLPLKQLGMTIENQYPKYDDVLKALTAGRDVMSKAWCRVFSMDKEFNIFHRGGYHVGVMVNAPRREYELFDNSWWAKEALEESLA